MAFFMLPYFRKTTTIYKHQFYLCLSTWKKNDTRMLTVSLWEGILEGGQIFFFHTGIYSNLNNRHVLFVVYISNY